MSIELLEESTDFAGINENGYPSALMAAAYDPCALDRTRAALGMPGSLIRGEWPTAEQTASLSRRLGMFAAERVVRFTPELPDTIDDETVFVGGVCALSTRESTLLGNGQVESPVDGAVRRIEKGDAFENFSDVVTAIQVFETIGLVPNPSAIVLEDSLWSDRVIQKLSGTVEVGDSLAESTRQSIETRNQRSYEALKRLRKYLFDSPSELTVVRDTTIMEDLVVKTDEMLAKLGLPAIQNSYRLVYAGMYSYVWREIMASQGVVDADQLMVIYEPWKHFAPEDGAYDAISTFRREMLTKAPFMVEGSDNERVGLIAYVEPRDPNGRILRKSMPVALLPNSLNYTGFDFGRFPIVPKKANALPSTSEFQFADETSSLALSRNPAFLWGLVYPPTNETRSVMRQMVVVSSECRTKSKSAFQGEVTLSPKEKQEFARQLKQSYSQEMGRLSERLIGELQTITAVLFGGDDETK